MKVSSTELPPRQVSLAIEVEQERLDRAMEDALRRLAGRVDVPGFRRGKAPRQMLERMIGRDRIVEEALDRLLPDVVNEAIEQEKVEPYTRPRVESVEFEPLRVRAVVGLAPRVELGDYRGQLTVAAEAATVGAEKVDDVIERLRGSYAQWAPVDRPVQLGDRVGLDLRVTADGRPKPVLDSKEAEYIVDPAGAQPVPGFAEQLVGLPAGDQKHFSVQMPDDYREQDVRGKPAEVDITLHWVKERELPAIDDEFAQQVGEYADLAALRAAIEAQLREREEERVRGELEEAVMSKLVEISSIDFPPQLVEHQAQHMLEVFQRSVEQRGLQLQQYLRLVGKEQDTFEQEIRAEAESRVRRSLALDAFASAEQIGPEPTAGGEAEERPAAASSAAAERQARGPVGSVDEAQDVTRERKALARLIELATGDGRMSQTSSNIDAKNTAEVAATSDTGTTSREAQDRGSA